ncbi:hypothetical protein AK88_04360 [Plasmodium fragile]|uniref:Uncharacterized protein n=1 Tax=Plasmodium fragile TaxID=5857 RepID=A0A0D9QG85_PLAFR|nr:uncharacterized protein AK88_04360 [Plasmodium fragile]KJP86029.1 hypothetical protein AK88_04360 [Plasmodium fragile]
MINIILTYLAAITIFCSVHDAKICYDVHRRNTKSNVLFIEKNAYHKVKYRLKAKEFVNFREIQLQRIKDYRKRSGPDKNNINYNVKDAYNYHDNLYADDNIVS